MVKVKICGITNLSDALTAVEVGADALGFNFWAGSRRYLTPAAAREIVAQMPAGVMCVGVFVNEAAPVDVERAAAEADVGAVQLHGEETPEFCAGVKGFEVIKAVRVGGGFRSEMVVRFATEAVLLDAYSESLSGGTGQTFDWALAKEARVHVKKLYLAGGLTPENVGAAVEQVGPYAVDVCSGVESAPGKKDAGRVRAFVEAARAATYKT
ncbi:MAG TPA: phosphoribosylanthranilate isomerase [Pyrinomonadaceae bacterium]